MENLKKKISNHLLYKDVFDQELVIVEARLVSAKMRKKFFLWMKEDMHAHNPDFKLKIPQPKNEMSVEARSLTEGLFDFAKELREDGFYVDIVSKMNEDGSHYFDLKADFSSPEEVKKRLTSPEYKKMKERSSDSRYQFGISGEMNKLFEKYCCTGKMKYYDHQGHNLYADIVREIYKNLLAKGKIPKPKPRDKQGNITVRDEKTAETVQIMKAVVLWERFGKMTVIEAFTKGKEKSLKKHFKL